jgi:hypothetical protein
MIPFLWQQEEIHFWQVKSWVWYLPAQQQEEIYF